MKLKTLNDLFKFKLKEHEHRWYDRKEIIDEIKAEAIKWVKECRILRTKAIEQLDHLQHIRNDAQIGWIKNFFNITEKDLQ